MIPEPTPRTLWRHIRATLKRHDGSMSLPRNDDLESTLDGYEEILSSLIPIIYDLVEAVTNLQTNEIYAIDRGKQGRR